MNEITQAVGILQTEVSAPFEVTGQEDLKGTGFYPSTHALWHLKALGVLDDLMTCSSAVWSNLEKSPGAPVRVAIIDTPVAWTHPNLAGVIDRALMRDFSVHDDGAFLVPDLAETDNIAARDALVQITIEIAASSRGSADDAAIFDLTRALALRIVQEDTDRKAGRPSARPPCDPVIYGAHGTALAGLIGARPGMVDLVRPALVLDSLAPAETKRVPLPYAGINPFCTIIPISTTAAPDPAMVTSALIYAGMVKADVVVIAAAWDDVVRNAEGDDAIGPEWDIATQALAILARNAIVLCAAGNSGHQALAYPASLVPTNNGAYAVTACTAQGSGLTYAPALTGANVVQSLSAEAPHYDRDGALVDPWAERDPVVGYAGDDPFLDKTLVREITVPSRLISLDCPGPYGYNPSPFRYTPEPGKPYLEIHSLFCEFSGTSAATAVAAGLVSLALQVRRAAEAGGSTGDGTIAKPIQTGPQSGTQVFDLEGAMALVASRKP